MTSRDLFLQAMNFPVKSLSTVPSCTKSVTIRTDGGDIIKLKQNREVTVNGEEVVLQPSVWIDGVIIRHASSVFLAGYSWSNPHRSSPFLKWFYLLCFLVELPNGLEIWWDGQSRSVKLFIFIFKKCFSCRWLTFLWCRVYIDAPPTFFGTTKVWTALLQSGSKRPF